MGAQVSAEAVTHESPTVLLSKGPFALTNTTGPALRVYETLPGPDDAVFNVEMLSRPIEEDMECTDKCNLVGEMPLPEELVLLCLARVPRSRASVLRAVCRSWRTIVDQEVLWSVRKSLGVTEDWLYVLERLPNTNHGLFWTFDPTTNRWHQLGEPKGLTGIYTDSTRLVSGGDSLYIVGAEFRPNLASDSEAAPEPKGARQGHGSGDKFKTSHGRDALSGPAVLPQLTASLSTSATPAGGDEPGCSPHHHFCETPVMPLGGVWRYDVLHNRVTRVSSLRTSRAGFAAVGLAGRLYVAGGSGPGGQTLRSAEVYDPATDKWQAIESMSIGRRKCVGIPFEGRLLVVANSYVENPQITRTAELYDPETGQWSVLRGMLPSDATGRLNTKLAVLGSDLYLTKHVGRSAHELRKYAPDANAWTSMGRLPVAGFFVGFTLAGMAGKLHVVGGRWVEGGCQHSPCPEGIAPTRGPTDAVDKCKAEQAAPYLHIYDPQRRGVWGALHPRLTTANPRSCTTCAVVTL